MGQRAGRAKLWMGCALVALMATACFQNIDEEGSPNALSMGLPSPTFTLFPTETDTPPPNESVIDETAIAFAQETLNAQNAQDILLSDTGGFATETPPVVAQIDDVAATPGVIDNFALSATVFVANITQTSQASLTRAAESSGLGVTPFPTEFPTNDPAFGVPLSTPTPVSGIGPGGVCIHIVKNGDNLFRLSLLYGVSVNNLAAANGITNIQMIYVNQEITIPACGTTGVYPPPTPQPLVASGGTGGFGTPSGSETLSSQSASVCNQHLVQQYESLFQISLLYNVPVQSIANANGIANVNNIIMATTLQIPCA